MSEEQNPIQRPFESWSDVAVHVPDLDKARTFYGEVMGFRLLEETGSHLAFDTGRFTLWVNRDDQVMSYIPAFAVASCEQAKERLIAGGCRIVKEFPEARSLYFADPFGIVADIFERRR